MSTVNLPVTLARDGQQAALNQDDLLAAGSSSWDLNPEQWVRMQLLRLALASVLEARLLNVRTSRLAAFGLSGDPESTTLLQLAALHRSHHGTAGQAFELAVADACNAGVPEVTGPLTEALRLLGVSAEGPLRLQVLGLEKIPQNQAAVIAEQLRAQLPTDGVLRTGARGRPANVDTVLARLTEASWASVPKPSLYEPQVNQLPRADALLVSGPTMVPVSIKIRSRAVSSSGWSGVPLWITLDPGSCTDVRRRDDARYPLVVVRLGQGSWSTAFYQALELLDSVARDLDRGRSLRRAEGPWTNITSRPIARQVAKLRNEPISTVADELRKVHTAVLEQGASGTATARGFLDVPILQSESLHEGWRTAADEGAVFVGQRHLFLPQIGDGRFQPHVR